MGFVFGLMVYHKIDRASGLCGDVSKIPFQSTHYLQAPAYMACIFTIWGDADGLVCPNVQTVPPAFSLHPSRVLWCLACCGMKIKSQSALCAVWVKNSCHWLNTKPVGVSLLTNAACHSPLMKLAHSHREHADCSHAPRGNPFNDALRHPGGGACCQALRPPRNGLTPRVEP
jgi:hypothetical protein